MLRQGNYLSAVADIGVFEQSLTTDLLNHLVFVQKVFMKVCILINNQVFSKCFNFYDFRKLMKLFKKFMEVKSLYLYG